MNFNDFKLIFRAYVSNFRTENSLDSDAIKLKIIHSERVSNQIFYLGKELGLDANDLETARIAGLFHDIGRFRQYQDYRTFNDAKSENHALLGLDEIDRFGLLDGIPPEQSGIIRFAIENHNKKAITEVKDRKTRFFALLLRDADKLDIWRVMIAHVKKGNTGCHDPVTRNMPHSNFISDGIIDYLESGVIVPLSEVKNLNDFKIFLISWIFDLNFRPALEAASRRRIIQAVYSTFPESCRKPGLVKKLENRLSAMICSSSGLYSCFL